MFLEKYIINKLLMQTNSTLELCQSDCFLYFDKSFIKSIFSYNIERFYDIQCCILSSLLYVDLLDDILDYIKDLNITMHSITTHNNIKYGIFSSNNIIFIVLKSSTTIFDFYNNTNIKLVETHHFDGLLHSGFLNIILDNKKDIYSKIKPLLNSYDTVLITGHSLGGSLSVILYKLLSRDFSKKDIRNITFGSPKIGNQDFCTKTITKRIVNTGDIISYIPFTFLGYCHVDFIIKPPYKMNNCFHNSILKNHLISQYYMTLKYSL